MLCYFCMHEKGGAAVCPYCHMQGEPVPLAHQLRPGTVIGGRYVVGRVLGEGGFGITYLGYYPKLDMTVAVKEYYPNGMAYRSNDGTYSVYVRSQDTAEFFNHGKERFLSEARTLARFKSEPGIVSVLDFIEENGTAYLIMEYLDGMTLQQYLKQRGTMSADEAFTLLRPAMQTLDKVHAAGVIHRDISPDNIMRLHSGQLKLMDFGAAREYTDDHKSLSVMLKKGYAPAEQYNRKGEQGPWTDVYALCATIYRCITGKAPSDSLDRVFEDDLIPPSQLGATITPAQEKVLLKGLAIKKQDRWQNISELLDAWAKANQAPAHTNSPYDYDLNRTIAADDDGRYAQPEITDPNVTVLADAPVFDAARAEQTPKKTSWRKRIIFILIWIAVVAAGVTGAVLLNNRQQDDAVVVGGEEGEVSADDFEYDISDNTVTITGYTGDQEEVEIPQKIKRKPVTSIGYYAFSGCSSLTSVTIPDSVTSIGDSAFSGCSSLESVKIPDSVTTIGESAFSGCTGLKTVTIPASVKIIRSQTFDNCTGLTSVTIPDSVTSIGDSAFSGCSSLTSVTIPDSVTSLGSFYGAVFDGCSDDLVIYGYSGSEAEKYANKNNIAFESIG